MHSGYEWRLGDIALCYVPVYDGHYSLANRRLCGLSREFYARQWEPLIPGYYNRMVIWVVVCFGNGIPSILCPISVIIIYCSLETKKTLQKIALNEHTLNQRLLTSQSSATLK